MYTSSNFNSSANKVSNAVFKCLADVLRVPENASNAGRAFSTSAKAASQAALAFDDKELLQIAKEQVEWILGKNPFARSYMYGEGYDYTGMYTEFMFDMVGEVPVGIQTQDDHDLPFMPVMNAATYYEVWVNSTAKLLWTIADLY